MGSKFITSTDSIAENFNKYFTEIGPNLANKISTSFANFDTYLNDKCNMFQPENALSINELKDAFYSLKTNKSPFYDDISCNITKHVYDIYLQSGVFPEEMKIARVTPIFIEGEVSDLGNNPLIFILCCFPKILEKIMYNRLYKYLLNNNILYKKQFRFQENHSTDHAIIQLADQISVSFEKKIFCLRCIYGFVKKAFDAVDHVILIKKIDRYGVKGRNLLWFKGYLNNHRQFITYDNSNMSFANISCGVPQESIFGPLLFLLYINDLPNASPVLDPIMYADGTNLFYFNNDIEALFSAVNMELGKISEWFKANKL